MLLRSFLLAATLAAVVLPSARAQIQLPLHLTDGAVVQRGQAMPVWGRAAPGAAVRVSFDGAERSATAGPDGRWRVDLPAHAAGGPFELGVRAGADRLVVRDVLVGDLWIASGQSNMEWPVSGSRDAETLAVTDRTIRHFKVPRSWAEAAQDTLAGGRWVPMTPESVGAFTAVGTFFARALREHTDVPIGILNTTWGGSRIEPWMSAEALGLDAGNVDSVFAGEQVRLDALIERVRDRLGALPGDAVEVDGVSVWAAPDLDEAGWTTLNVPGPWEGQGYDGMDGVAWYRTAFDLTEAEAAAGVTLGLGKIDDSDDSYVNGVRIGGMVNSWTVARRYDVPASALRAGRNVVAIRVEDTQGGGGIGGEPSDVYVETADGARRSRAGTWRFRVEQASLSLIGSKNQVPTALWNAMVAPLLPSPIAGVIWYQGESNADRMADAEAYRDLFPAMIRSWREAWGDVPFLYVQLANYHDATDDPGAPSQWAVLRENQSATLSLPRTAQAVTIGVGEAGDIHPRDKKTVGYRLALAARQMVYGEPHLVASGPTLRSATATGASVALVFDHVGGGLGSRDGAPLGGFAVAGLDGRWAWAEARIDGDQVIVSSPDVPAPVAVRYAWADNPERATLVSADGLPAGPFRAENL